MDLKKKAFKGVQWTSLSSISNAVIQFLRIAILARLLEASDFGLMAIVMMIMGFMSLFSDMGINSAILHKQKISTKEYSSLYWFNFMINGFLMLFIILSSFGIAAFFNEPKLTILIPLMSINLLFTALGRQFAVVAQKNLHFRFISLVEILTSIVSLIPAVILAVNGFGVYSLIYSTLFASLCSNLCFFIRFRKKHRIRLHYKFAETKSFLKIGLFQSGGQILNYFNTQFDVILIGKLLGTDVLGIYNLAKNLAMRPMQVINPIVTRLSAPILAKMQDDPDMLKDSFLKIVRYLSYANFPIHFFIAAFSLPIINVVYGMDDSTMASILSILSLFYMIRSIGNPIGGLVIAKGRTDIEFYWNVGVFAVFPLFIYIGSMHSVVGVAIAQLLFMVLSYIPGWFFMVKKLIHASLKNYIMPIVPSLLVSATVSVCSVLLLSLFPFSNIVVCIVGFLFFMIIFVLCIFLYDKDIYKIVSSMFRKKY